MGKNRSPLLRLYLFNGFDLFFLFVSKHLSAKLIFNGFLLEKHRTNILYNLFSKSTLANGVLCGVGYCIKTIKLIIVKRKYERAMHLPNAIIAYVEKWTENWRMCVWVRVCVCVCDGSLTKLITARVYVVQFINNVCHFLSVFSLYGIGKKPAALS